MGKTIPDTVVELLKNREPEVSRTRADRALNEKKNENMHVHVVINQSVTRTALSEVGQKSRKLGTN